MYAELPLSTRILLVLNPSIFSIMTKGSLWGCFTPLASPSLKDMSLSVRRCLYGGMVWTLFTCLWYAFLRDLNDPPENSPPVIVFISPITSYRGWDGQSSSQEEDPCWFLLPSLNLLYSLFFTYFCNFPFRINSSICSFRSLCCGCDLCGIGSTCSCNGHWGMSAVVLAI